MQRGGEVFTAARCSTSTRYVASPKPAQRKALGGPWVAASLAGVWGWQPTQKRDTGAALRPAQRKMERAGGNYPPALWLHRAGAAGRSPDIAAALHRRISGRARETYRRFGFPSPSLVRSRRDGLVCKRLARAAIRFPKECRLITEILMYNSRMVELTRRTFIGTVGSAVATSVLMPARLLEVKMIKPTTTTEQMMYCTARIVGVNASGDLFKTGTGFFYQFPVGAGDARNIPILVTNKHVVDGVAHADFVIHTNSAGGDKPDGKGRVRSQFSEWIPHPNPKDRPMRAACWARSKSGKSLLPGSRSLHRTHGSAT